MRVGIPQGLFYVYYYPLWKTFFTDLGVEVLSTPPSNRKIIDQGIAHAVDETCFPVKVYFGHIAELCQEEMDYLFVPRFVSVERKHYICPKFMGVPDMVRASFTKLPPLLSPLVDLSRTDKHWRKEIMKVGRHFTWRGKKIEQAYQHGMEELERFRQLTRQGYSPPEALLVWEGKKLPLPGKGDLNIGVLGHGYALYDEAISMGLIKRLREMECNVYMVEMIEKSYIESRAATLPKRVFWTLGRKIAGSALYLHQQTDIDGLIYLACFGCGPDSLIGDLVKRNMQDKPYMMLTVDEHSGEAGINTRLEAFCDMLRRRRINSESNLPTYGQLLYSLQGSVEGP